MSLLFTDSFDHYATADLAKKWTSHTNFSDITGTVTAGGRNGTSGFHTNYSVNGNNNSFTWLAQTISPVATVGLGFAYKCNVLPLSTSTMTIMQFLDTGTLHFDLRLRSDGTLQATRNGTSLGTSTSALSPGTQYHLEVKVLVSDTVGTVELRVNGSATGWINLTNQDTRNGGNATINSVAIGCLVTTTFALNFQSDFDDVVIWNTSGSVNNDFMGDTRVQCLFATGAGNSSQLTASAGSNYQCIDETAINSDTDFNSSATAGHVDTYVYEDIAAAGIIHAVIPQLGVKKTDAGTRSVAPVIRHSGTDYVGTDQNPTTSYAFLKQIYEVNPGTSNAFTPTEVNNCEYGIKVTV